MSGNWGEFLQNPKGIALRKFMSQVLGNKTQVYDDLLSRMGHFLVTENDLKLFADMINDVIDNTYKRLMEEISKTNQN